MAAPENDDSEAVCAMRLIVYNEYPNVLSEGIDPDAFIESTQTFVDTSCSTKSKDAEVPEGIDPDAFIASMQMFVTAANEVLDIQKDCPCTRSIKCNVKLWLWCKNLLGKY